MVVSRWNPWIELMSGQGRLDQLFAELSTPTGAADVLHSLPLDIRQTDEAFWIEASVPGFGPEDIEITVDENVLMIRGTPPSQHDHAIGGTYVQRERRLGSVHRHVSFPAQVSAEDITATFTNGVLTVMVPRLQRAEPKRVPVVLRTGGTLTSRSGASMPAGPGTGSSGESPELAGVGAGTSAGEIGPGA